MTKRAGGCQKLQEFFKNHSALQSLNMLFKKEEYRKKKKKRGRDCNPVLFQELLSLDNGA